MEYRSFFDLTGCLQSHVFNSKAKSGKIALVNNQPGKLKNFVGFATFTSSKKLWLISKVDLKIWIESRLKSSDPNIRGPALLIERVFESDEGAQAMLEALVSKLNDKRGEGYMQIVDLALLNSIAKKSKPAPKRDISELSDSPDKEKGAIYVRTKLSGKYKRLTKHLAKKSIGAFPKFDLAFYNGETLQTFAGNWYNNTIYFFDKNDQLDYYERNSKYTFAYLCKLFRAGKTPSNRKPPK